MKSHPYCWGHHVLLLLCSASKLVEWNRCCCFHWDSIFWPLSLQIYKSNCAEMKTPLAVDPPNKVKTSVSVFIERTSQPVKCNFFFSNSALPELPTLLKLANIFKLYVSPESTSSLVLFREVLPKRHFLALYILHVIHKVNITVTEIVWGNSTLQT